MARSARCTTYGSARGLPGAAIRSQAGGGLVAGTLVLGVCFVAGACVWCVLGWAGQSFSVWCCCGSWFLVVSGFVFFAVRFWGLSFGKAVGVVCQAVGCSWSVVGGRGVWWFCCCGGGGSFGQAGVVLVGGGLFVVAGHLCFVLCCLVILSLFICCVLFAAGQLAPSATPPSLTSISVPMPTAAVIPSSLQGTIVPASFYMPLKSLLSPPFS